MVGGRCESGKGELRETIRDRNNPKCLVIRVGCLILVDWEAEKYGVGEIDEPTARIAMVFGDMEERENESKNRWLYS